MIKEDEPLKPSTRLTETRASSVHLKHLDALITPKALRGELDWIVMKAIEKDRTLRYETANAFAADIGRYMDDEPVQAAAPSAAYKFRKFARRNKTAIGMAAVITLILMGATVVSGLQASRATEAASQATAAEQLASDNEKKAEDARVEAENARVEAEAVAQFLTETLQSPDPSKNQREIMVVRYGGFPKRQDHRPREIRLSKQETANPIWSSRLAHLCRP